MKRRVWVEIDLDALARNYRRIAAHVRRLQTGYLYHYALAMALGIFVLMSCFLWLGR